MSVLTSVVVACAAGIALLLAFTARPARALPSFAAQTGQPCTACHVGAFGPQLHAGRPRLQDRAATPRPAAKERPRTSRSRR